MWKGSTWALLKQLILKDFRVRYRNMSLGVLWSLLNPLVMLLVFTFVFTKIFTNDTPHFAVFLMCGIVPFNFFSLAWSTGTASIVENANLVKRVPFPREVVPVASVLSNCLHLLIQLGLLLGIALGFGVGLNLHWMWLPLILFFQIVFLCGLVLASSALNVYVRDTRYVVESAIAVLFWLIPIFYPLSRIPEEFTELYLYNPMAALVIAVRQVILEARAPLFSIMFKLGLVAFATLGVGLLVFGQLKRRFYDKL